MQGRLDFNAQKIVPGLSHRCEGVHLEIGKVTRRWLAFPHALTLGELLHQAFIVCVRKYGSIVRTVVIQQAVNLVDCLGTKLNPLALDKNGGANFEW